MEKLTSKILTSKGIIGKICVTFLIIYLSTLGVFIWIINQDNTNGNFINCVNNKYNDAINYFDKTFTITLGNLLEYIPAEFLPDLNDKFMGFKDKFRAINECLIKDM